MKATYTFISLQLINIISKTVSHEPNDHPNMTSPIDPCSQSPSTRHILMACFSISVFLTGILGNLVCIIVIQTSRHLRSQVGNLFLTSLAVADLGVSFCVTTFKIDIYAHDGSFCRHSYALCVFYNITDSLFPFTSITHLVVIGADRWYAISSPFIYVSNMTSRRGRLIVLLIWSYSIVWTLLGIIKWDSSYAVAYEIRTVGKQVTKRYCFSLNPGYHTTVVTVIYLLPMAVTTCLYVVVLHIATRQAAAISQCNPTKRKLKCRRLETETKATRTVSVVFLAYTICWLPHVIVVLMTYYGLHILINFSVNHPMTYDIVTTIISDILPPLNSCMNPFIYLIFSDQFRIAARDLYRKISNRKHELFPPGEHFYRASRSSSVATTDTRLNSIGNIGDIFSSKRDSCIRFHWNGVNQEVYGNSLV